MRIKQIYVGCDEPGCQNAIVVADTGIAGHADKAIRLKGWIILQAKHGTYEYCPNHQGNKVVVSEALEMAAA